MLEIEALGQPSLRARRYFCKDFLSGFLASYRPFLPQRAGPFSHSFLPSPCICSNLARRLLDDQELVLLTRSFDSRPASGPSLPVGHGTHTANLRPLSPTWMIQIHILIDFIFAGSRAIFSVRHLQTEL